MPAKVRCSLPNASLNMNGIDFVDTGETTEAGLRIVESAQALDDEMAATFASIPGFEMVRAAGRPKAAAPVAPVAPVMPATTEPPVGATGATGAAEPPAGATGATGA